MLFKKAMKGIVFTRPDRFSLSHKHLFVTDRYAGNYKPDGRQFIVVCGNINYESVGTFLADFFHPARDDVDVEVVFLNKAEPDLEFEGLLKREHTRVQYFQ